MISTYNTKPVAAKNYATGKRKRSIAKVFMTQGTGKFTVNNQDYLQYFPREHHNALIAKPFHITKTREIYNISCFVKGGGQSGQAEAIKHGISKILANNSDAMHSILRNTGHLTRDDRKVERKKYGQPKARKKFQFSKR